MSSSSSVNVTNSYDFLTLPTLTKSWNNTGVELTDDNEFTIPTAGLWTWTIKVTVEASQSNNFPLLGAVSINGNTSTFWSPAKNTFTGFLVLNKGDKVKGGYEAQAGSQTGEAPLVGGIVETCFSMMLLTPAVNTSTNPSNKNTNSNTGNNTDNSHTNSNTGSHSNTPITNPLTNFTVSPGNIQYIFNNNPSEETTYTITDWTTDTNQHLLGNTYVTVAEDATWTFSWILPNYKHKDGFNLNLEVLVNDNPLPASSPNSLTVPLKKGQQISFQLVGSFPNTAPISDQVYVNFTSNNSSLSAQKQVS